LREERSPSHWQRPVERSGHAAVSETTFQERKKFPPSNAIPATRNSVPVPAPAPPKAPEQVIPFAPIFFVILFPRPLPSPSLPV